MSFFAENYYLWNILLGWQKHINQTNIKEICLENSVDFPFYHIFSLCSFPVVLLLLLEVLRLKFVTHYLMTWRTRIISLNLIYHFIPSIHLTLKAPLMQ